MGAMGIMFFAALPATTNYQLNSYGFGSGGTSSSGTNTYSLEGTSGELSGQTGTTGAYNSKPGFTEVQQANVPKISSFDNNGGLDYNKLHFVLDQQNNPSDALYALQISTSSDFSSNISYVKSDLTIGPTLALADYQTYQAWGGASGSNIIGLNSGTTYYLRAKATQGKFTESGYGPSASAITANPSLSFSLSTNSINIGSLLPNTVVTSPSSITLGLTTNAGNGATVYLHGLNSGLKSPTAPAFTISSASGDLSSLADGYGAQSTANSELSAVSPYNGVSNSIGVVDTIIRSIYTASGPVSDGSGTFILKAKSAPTDKAASNYTDTLTLLASASF